MISVFISYARADGTTAAAALRKVLVAMGFTVWLDVEEMRGGQPWKDQLRQALRSVDAVIVLLTPGAVSSEMVRWEWEAAQMLEKRLIALLVQPCAVPEELRALHYHTLADPATDTLGLAKLARDLIDVALSKPAAAPPPSEAPKYSIGKAVNSSIGDNATVVNLRDAQGVDAALLARVLAVLQARSSGLDAVTTAQVGAELAAVRMQLAQIGSGVDALGLSQAALLARFDDHEQQVLATILARLDLHTSTLTSSILDTLQAGAVAADELDRHLTAIEAALHDFAAHAPAGADPQLADAAGQVLALAEQPGMALDNRLKLTIPIIPLVLAYEGEITFANRLHLEAAWQALQRLATGGQ